MLKQTVNYTDFDDQPATEVVYFNLSKSDLASNMTTIETFEKVRKMLSGKKRDLEAAEIQMIIDMVKKIMELSYGVRSEDGKRFIKTTQQWIEFTQTAVYDSFLMSLFENPQSAVEFVSGIIPKGLREEAIAKAKATVDEALAKDNVIATVPETSSVVTVLETASTSFSEPGLTPEQREAAIQDYMRKNDLS